MRLVVFKGGFAASRGLEVVVNYSSVHTDAIIFFQKIHQIRQFFGLVGKPTSEARA